MKAFHCPSKYGTNRSGAKYIFEGLLHSLVRKLCLHLKETKLHLQSKNTVGHTSSPVPGRSQNIGH